MVREDGDAPIVQRTRVIYIATLGNGNNNSMTDHESHGDVCS